MACSNCKQKNKEIIGEEKFQRRADFVDSYGGWIIFIWSLLGLYGLFSLISKFL